jgi:hypothetical protein
MISTRSWQVISDSDIRPLVYAFVFNGSVNGQPIDERFESGPNTFQDVTSPESLEVPEAVPPVADLAEQTQAANATAQAALQRATLFGLGGVAVGVAGVILAAVALLSRSRSSLADLDDSLDPPVVKH